MLLDQELYLLSRQAMLGKMTAAGIPLRITEEEHLEVRKIAISVYIRQIIKLKGRAWLHNVYMIYEMVVLRGILLLLWAGNNTTKI